MRLVLGEFKCLYSVNECEIVSGGLMHANNLAPHQPLSFCLLSVRGSCRIIVCMYTTFNNEKQMLALRIKSAVERMHSIDRHRFQLKIQQLLAQDPGFLVN